VFCLLGGSWLRLRGRVVISKSGRFRRRQPITAADDNVVLIHKGVSVAVADWPSAVTPLALAIQTPSANVHHASPKPPLESKIHARIRWDWASHPIRCEPRIVMLPFWMT
jgi:hypothetical protein